MGSKKSIKILYHINAFETWGKFRETLKNTIRDAKDGDYKLNILIVANGGAITEYDAGKENGIVREITHENIKYFACQNAVNKHNDIQMVPGVTIVFNSSIFIAQMQQAGYAYIKP